MELVGSQSNIPYRELFDAYKNILITNSHNDDPITGELYRYYNRIVFHWEADGTHKVNPHNNSEDEPYYSSGVEDAIRANPKDFHNDIYYHAELPVSNNLLVLHRIYWISIESHLKLEEFKSKM